MKSSHFLTRRQVSFVLRLFWLLALALLVLQIVNVVRASTPAEIVVNSTADTKKGNDGLCTLREAIIAANADKPSGGKKGECIAGNGADTIILPAGTYVLSRTDNGKEDASQTGDLDITGNLEIVGGPGATIDGSWITDRVFHILNGEVTITGVAITGGGGNVDDGAGIYNAGNLTLTNVTVSGNGNTADVQGGGIYNAGTLTLNNVTVAYNSGGGIVDAGGDAVYFRNTIIASNAPDDCSGTLSSLGHNLVQNTEGCTITGNITGNIINQDPLLGPLQDNGGNTLTHALLPGSPAIDAGDDDFCPILDQRGEPRPMDGDRNGSYYCDIGALEVGWNPLALSPFVLLRAFPEGDGTTIHGLLNGAGNTPLEDIELEFFSNSACDPTDPGDLVLDVTGGETDDNGYFIVANVPASGQGQLFVTATARNPNDGTLLRSNCVPVSAPNDSWPDAFELTLEPFIVSEHYIDGPGQSRWYKIKVEPNSELTIILSGVNPEDPTDTDFRLPADFDLTLYKDIQAAFDAIVNPDAEDIVRLSAQYAGASYSGASYSGASYSGASYSGASYSGASYSGASYSGASYSGASYSGASYSGASYSGASYSGASYSGASYSGASYSGASYSGASYSGASYSDAVFGGASYSEAYSDAQSRSLLAISAIGGTAPETIFVHTWNSDEYYYLRVLSNNGESSLDEPFRLEIRLEPGSCSDVEPLPDIAPIGPEGPDDNPTTLILYDSTRLALIEGSIQADGEIDVVAKLNSLANSVDGLVLDVSSDPRVQFANGQADADEDGDGVPDLVGCPYAKNLVAQAIRDIVDGYRTQDNSNLKYVVVVGGDAVIPSFRHPDFASLAKESQYIPPVKDDSPSQAALRLDYILSDNDYVAKEVVPLGNSSFPILDPNVAIGRLVETAADMNAVIDAFLSTTVGVVQPQTALVTGYDFLEDTADEVAAELESGLGCSDCVDDELITPQSVNITDPEPGEFVWTADDLREKLLDSGPHDLVFLAGHFSGNSALAADYVTEMPAFEVANSDVDMENSIIFSIGCHAGYNIVNQDGIPGVTGQPDWAQAFASKGATLIAGTGYQYGETLTKEYSERLYIEFAKRLRLDVRDENNNLLPVSIGHALNAAKLAYITQVPSIRGTHEKVLLESTLFGLPMLSVDLPGRFTPPADEPEELNLYTFETDPGDELGLQYANLTVESPLPLNVIAETLTDVDTGIELPGEFLSGNDGEVTFPTEPFLPLEIKNVTVPDTVLRGIGFRGGNYWDVLNVLPLTGAPTTEAIALHLSWQTEYFHPTQMHNASYLGALIDDQQRILFTPAQHIAGDTVEFFDPGDPNNKVSVRMSHRRQFSQMEYRLFYSNYDEEFCHDPNDPDTCHNPAFSAPPSIIHVSGASDGDEVTFWTMVVGDPSAGMQAVWVTWTEIGTAGGPGTWQSLDLTQRESDTRIWEGTLPLNGMDPDNIRYMVQAVNGFGLVGQNLNNGYFHTPGLGAIPTVDTVLTLDASNPISGTFGDLVDFSAVLEFQDGIDENGDPVFKPLKGQTVEFKLGPGLSAQGTTDDFGEVTVTLALVGLPGDMKLYAAFDGNAPYKASSDVADFRIEKQQPSIEDLVEATTMVAGYDSGIGITLLDGNGDPLREQTVFFVVTDANGNIVYSASMAKITDLFGQVFLGPLSLPAGTYSVTAFYNGSPLGIQLSSDAYEPAQEVAALTVTNIAPLAVNDSATTDEDTPVTIDVAANDTDVDGNLDPATVSVLTPPVSGSTGVDPVTGEVTYTPAPDIYGDDNFTYQICDLGSECDTATVNITVNPINDPPVAADDSATTDEDTGVTIDVLANDSDVDDATLTVDSVTQATNGTVTIDGSNVTYTPAPNYYGSDSFTYVVSDGSGGTDTAKVWVTVNPVNDPPVANDDSASTQENTAVTIDVAANDTDVDSNLDPTSATIAIGPSHGTLTNNNDGTFEYEPTPDYDGPDSFDYKICDTDGLCDTATVYITVLPVNDPPVANDDSVSMWENTTVTIDVADNDTDEDDNLDPTSATVVSDPSSGTAVPNGDGTFTYTPDTDYNGSDSFNYEICDTDGLCDTATVYITVLPVNAPPTCSLAEPSTPLWSPDKTIHPVSVIGVTDPEGDPFTIVIDGIFQDEPVRKGKYSQDGWFTDDPNTVEVLAERDGKGDGRVYHLYFTATDEPGNTCAGRVRVAVVPHDQGDEVDIDAIDGGPCYNSTDGSPTGDPACKVQ